MLNLAVRNTGKLIREKSKTENVRLGRLFTKKDTARLMAESIELSADKAVYTVLDPGAGTGILSAAVIERICKSAPLCRQIFLTCYENNPDFIPMLKDNLERIRKKCRHDYDVRLFVTVNEENYITESKNHYTVAFFDTVAEKFDIIIANPPTEFCEKSSDEAISAGGVTQLKINYAFLFLSMAKGHLEENGQLVIMLPTTYASAASLAPLRMEIKNELSVMGIHLFIGKQKNAKRAVPLKKSFIIRYKRALQPDTVSLSASYDTGKELTKLSDMPYDFIIDPKTGAITLPKSAEDARIVKFISAMPETLATLGLKMSTGLIIDSKCSGMIFDSPVEGTLPVIRHNAIKNGTIAFPAKGTKGQFIAPLKKALMQKNRNMIVIKRIPAKSDERFVNSAIYLAAQLPQYKYISTHNKVNFIDMKNKNTEICPRLAFGLFALLNSTVYDRYISIVSKSKQINAKELKELPLPSRHIIESIGLGLMAARQTSVRACDTVVNNALHIIEK